MSITSAVVLAEVSAEDKRVDANVLLRLHVALCLPDSSRVAVPSREQGDREGALTGYAAIARFSFDKENWQSVLCSICMILFGDP
jgi:hypothetical protein